jgi:hypothetical protein
MRPDTLAWTAERVASGHWIDRALPRISRRESALRSLAYLRGGFGERLPHVPDWAYSPRRYLDRAWHASEIADDGMREYLTFSSPAEFASRNIFTEERPLRRARGPRPPETENR